MGLPAHEHGPEARDTKYMGKDAHATPPGNIALSPERSRRSGMPPNFQPQIRSRTALLRAKTRM
jgi:hypothetical protein